MWHALVISLLTVLVARPGEAQGDPWFATRLPVTTSFYVSTEHMGEVVSAIARSTFYRELYGIPSLAKAVEQGRIPDLAARWDELVTTEQGPLLRAVASLLEREVVVASTGDGSRGIVPGLIQLARIALLSQEYRIGGSNRAVGDRLHAVAENLAVRLGVDPVLLACRTDRREMLEPLVTTLLSRLPPSLASSVSVEEIEGTPFTTLTVIPSLLFPAENLVPSLRQVVSDSVAVESLLATYRGIIIKVRLCWIGDYLVVIVEDQEGALSAQVAGGPKGKSLADRGDFTALLARSGTHPVRRVVLDLSGWRANLAAQLAEVADDLHVCHTIMGIASGLGLSAEVLDQKLQEFVTSSLDPVVSVAAADLDRGVRVVADLHHAPQSRACIMGSKKLALASRIPSSALAWAVWGGPHAGEAWRAGLDEAIKWRSMPWSTLSMPAEQRAFQSLITDLMVFTRDSLPPALGEEGMVVLACDGSLTRIKDRDVDLTIPELGVVVEIIDRERIRSLGSAYARRIAALLSRRSDSIVEFPLPSSKKVKDGEQVWWNLESLEGEGVVPTIYLTKHHLIVSSSARLADELYQTARGKRASRRWPDREVSALLSKPSSAAGVILVSDLAARLAPLVEFAIAESETEPAEASARARADIAAGLRLLEVIPLVWAHTTIGGDCAYLTGRMDVRDLP